MGHLGAGDPHPRPPHREPRMIVFRRDFPGPPPVRYRNFLQRRRCAGPRIAAAAGAGLASLTMACGAAEPQGAPRTGSRAERPLVQTHTPPGQHRIRSKTGGAVHLLYVDARLLELPRPAQWARAADIAWTTFHEVPPAARASAYIIEFTNQADPRPPRVSVQYFFRRAQLKGTSAPRYVAPVYTTLDTVTQPSRPPRSSQ